MLKELKIERTYPLFTDYKFHFIIIGCGGNGSELAPKLCRQLSFKRDSFGNQLHDITIIDKDKVEEKNLLRQNFFRSDLDRNKAETMAMKCSTLFNITVRAFDTYVEKQDELDDIISSSDKVPFIIGCVDTNAVRKMIHEYVRAWKRKTPLFWLDAGNEEFAGQVVLSHKLMGGTKIKLETKVEEGEGEDKITRRTYIYNLPTVCDHYPDMLESTEKFASQLSCAERAVSNPQAADTNVEAATILYQFISNCLRGSIDYHHVTFNVIKGNRLTRYNDESILKSFKIRFNELEGTEDDGDDEDEDADRDLVNRVGCEVTEAAVFERTLGEMGIHLQAVSPPPPLRLGDTITDRDGNIVGTIANTEYTPTGPETVTVEAQQSDENPSVELETEVIASDTPTVLRSYAVTDRVGNVRVVTR